MACSKAEDLINQLIEATLKLLDFGLNIMDALRVQKLLTIRNQKIGLISDDACLPECSLRFSLNFDLMMFNKLLRNACLRARATLNELRVCRLRYPNAPLVLEPKTKLKFHKLQKKIQDFDEAVRSDKMIARRDLRDFREISIIFSQLEHDLKLLICSLECASTMKDTVLFAAPITDVMTVLSIVLNRLERLAQKAEIDEKIAAAEQQKALQEQKQPATAQSNSATPHRRQQSTPPATNTRTADHPPSQAKNTNRTSQQRRQDMTAMIAAASQQNIVSHSDRKVEHRRRDPSAHSETSDSMADFQENASMNFNMNKQTSKSARQISRHYTSIKSNVLARHPSRAGRAMDALADEIPPTHRPVSRRQIKQFRQEFVQKWTTDVRQTCKQPHQQQQHHHEEHIFRADSTDRMTKVKREKHDRYQNKAMLPCHSSSASSSLSSVNEIDQSRLPQESSSSTTRSPPIDRQRSIRKHRNASSNNSANVYLQSSESNENLECQIS